MAATASLESAQRLESKVPETTLTHKGLSRKTAILEVAKNLLVEKGFAAISFRNVSKRADVTVGNVTYYFPTKEHLMDELAAYIFDRWEEGFRRRKPDDLHGAVEIFDYSIRYMIEENKRPGTNALLQEMWAMASRSEIVMRMLDTFYARVRHWILEVMPPVEPPLSDHTRKLRAALITAQIEGLIVLIGPRRIPHDEMRGLEDAAVEAARRLATEPEA